MSVLVETGSRTIKEMTATDLVHMVGKLRRNFGNWNEVFEDSMQGCFVGLGEYTKGMLSSYKERLLLHKKLLREDQHHEIKVDTCGKGPYARTFYVIDGFQIEFIGKDVNSQMQWLLRGARVSTMGKGALMNNIETEVSFLNEYFGLKLVVEEDYGPNQRTRGVHLGNLRDLDITRSVR